MAGSGQARASRRLTAQGTLRPPSVKHDASAQRTMLRTRKGGGGCTLRKQAVAARETPRGEAI